ncbi:membrane protein [Sphingobacterium sp. IITKGP-BTPF85]|nr:membrane protein [Sphingobacterium sp. IITKGP-BTPF85]
MVIALCSGGTFLTVQLAMALVFKQPLTWMQILGSTIIVIGMVLVTFGAKE